MAVCRIGWLAVRCSLAFVYQYRFRATVYSVYMKRSSSSSTMFSTAISTGSNSYSPSNACLQQTMLLQSWFIRLLFDYSASYSACAFFLLLPLLHMCVNAWVCMQFVVCVFLSSSSSLLVIFFPFREISILPIVYAVQCVRDTLLPTQTFGMYITHYFPSKLYWLFFFYFSSLNKLICCCCW